MKEQKNMTKKGKKKENTRNKCRRRRAISKGRRKLKKKYGEPEAEEEK